MAMSFGDIANTLGVGFPADGLIVLVRESSLPPPLGREVVGSAATTDVRVRKRSTDHNIVDAPMTGLKTRIETPFVQESVAFYSQHLGMKVVDSWDDNGDKGVILGLASSVQNEALLELAYIETPKRYEGISLQFRVRNLGAIAEQLRNHLQFRGPKQRPWGGTYLYLEDPTGIEVILYEGVL